MFFGLRFDLRNPEIAATTMAERYSAALDMVQWAMGMIPADATPRPLPPN